MDEGEIVEHVEAVSLCYSKHKQHTMDTILQATVCAENSGLFGTKNEMESRDAIIDSHHDVVFESNPRLEQAWEKNYSDPKDMWKEVAINNNTWICRH
jgi:hypothetical protein